MNLSLASYGKLDNDEHRFKVLDRVFEVGATFWDTANMYGDSEDLVGKWFKRDPTRREKIFLADKFGIKYNPKNPMEITFDSSPEYCREACEKSLERLGTGYIDLYYVHHITPSVPIEATMRTLVELKNEGKIRYIGLSNITSATIRRAHKIHPITAIQQEYNPFTLDVEKESSTHLLKTCRELGIALGNIGADAKDMRSKVFPRFSEENRDANQKVVEKFGKLAEKKGCNASQLALAWLLKQGNDVFPNPGTKSVKHFEENWAALSVELSDEDEKEIRRFVETAEVVGGRLPEAFSHIPGDTEEEA
ncbi:hypothetical protein LTR97_006232 [Elasticomyces elasticus]|uniref:NADP-dependent oxidoreductase domain-containing protein n=1 Tax=Elasticomyces elasticus TaxID=574655 RepID=A0AAN8A1K5_9PEZI|nr:hypothetical protein LTR97_006232 [Elasticomyces elasticus]